MDMQRAEGQSCDKLHVIVVDKIPLMPGLRKALLLSQISKVMALQSSQLQRKQLK
jgi:hypothetical protein